MPNASSTPPAPREILSPWQKPLVRALLLGTVLVAGTGVFLVSTPGASPSAMSALVVHLVVGALLVPVLLVFAIPHAVAQTKRKPFIALSGAVVLLAALATAGPGVSLVAEPSGASSTTGTLHAVAGLAVLALYLLHRRFGTNPARWSVLGAGIAATAAVGFALHAWEQADPGHASIFESGTAEAAEAARGHFFPSSVTSGAGDLTLTSEDLRDLESCATCHQTITDEWKRSAHRHASMTNPFYRAARVRLFLAQLVHLRRGGGSPGKSGLRVEGKYHVPNRPEARTPWKHNRARPARYSLSPSRPSTTCRPGSPQTRRMPCPTGRLSSTCW